MRWITITLASAAAVAGLAAPTAGTPLPAGAESRVATTITVHARDAVRGVSNGLLGANHHYNRNGYGVWDPVADAPARGAVAQLRRSGVRSVRFPGGTVANLYDWKQAVTEPRGCQVSAAREDLPGYAPLTRGLEFGPDEFMELVERAGVAPFIMVPSATETPQDAADWVEYMNSPAGVPGNPNGGVDWADVRSARGHPRPYGVRRWEIANEPHHGKSRYWMSQDEGTAVRQYAFGGDRDVSGEELGKNCDHRPGGVVSDGSAGQVFEVLYPPVVSRSVSVTVQGVAWRRVADLGEAGPDDRVFVLRPRAGDVVFGDGEHGAVPASGQVVRASYRSVHDGFFEFARQMKAVDPRIKVCSAWGSSAFPELVGRRPFDCLTRHVITTFPGKQAETWYAPVEGHDRLMVAAGDRRGGTQQLRRSLPPGVPLWITEVSALQGDRETWQDWPASMSNAVFSATSWGDLLELGIPWAMGDDLLWVNRGVLGKPPELTMTALGLTRELLEPMMSGNGRVVSVGIRGNPVRSAPQVFRSYEGLAVTAVRQSGSVKLLVINRLPREEVTARVRLGEFRAGSRATLRTVAGSSFMSWNKPGEPPEVTLRTRHRPVSSGGFVGTFPAASVTVVDVPERR